MPYPQVNGSRLGFSPPRLIPTNLTRHREHVYQSVKLHFIDR